ncbi:hypothetical protein HGB47_08520 [Leptospira yasudae]|uniref:hypothetical protein n=1 Tax=Leptospira yasudae TaxID=2202201 RepID=UPI001C4FB380|nr:hypothetical protein [Leptospira yasudae]MBW0433658.1 hypothetical protein [Leptospira yasudae]
MPRIEVIHSDRESKKARPAPNARKEYMQVLGGDSRLESRFFLICKPERSPSVSVWTTSD